MAGRHWGRRQIDLWQGRTPPQITLRLGILWVVVGLGAALACYGGFAAVVNLAGGSFSCQISSPHAYTLPSPTPGAGAP